jgi:hypothetical protein
VPSLEYHHLIMIECHETISKKSQPYRSGRPGPDGLADHGLAPDLDFHGGPHRRTPKAITRGGTGDDPMGILLIVIVPAVLGTTSLETPDLRDADLARSIR